MEVAMYVAWETVQCGRGTGQRLDATSPSACPVLQPPPQDCASWLPQPCTPLTAFSSSNHGV